MSYQIIFTDELYHHGVKGQRWGVRRYRNEDGSLTNEGKARYEYKEAKKQARKARNAWGKAQRHIIGPGRVNNARKKNREYLDAIDNLQAKREIYKKSKPEKMSTKKKVAIGAAVVGSAALAGYGIHRYNKHIKNKVIDSLANMRDRDIRTLQNQEKGFDNVADALRRANSSKDSIKYFRDAATKKRFETYTTKKKYNDAINNIQKGPVKDAKDYLRRHNMSTKPMEIRDRISETIKKISKKK